MDKQAEEEKQKKKLAAKRYSKTWYDKHKEEIIKGRKLDLAHCKYCDKDYRKDSKRHHIKTSRHALYKEIYELKYSK